MMRQPKASLPKQMGSPTALAGAYHLLAAGAESEAQVGATEVTHAAIMTPHWQQTREAAGQQRVTLMVQDTTQIDHTKHAATTGLGPIGTGAGRGYLLQTVLAVVPKPRQVLGIAYQEPFLRQPVPPGETRDQRRKRRVRESGVWLRAARAVGQPPVGSLWVHVGDAYSDIFEFMEACRESERSHFLIRVAQDRLVETPLTSEPEGSESEEHETRLRHLHLLSFARDLPSQGERVLQLPARDQKPAREARVMIAFSSVAIEAPTHGPRKSAIVAWVIRVWEPTPPAEVEEPLEWLLITSVPTLTVDDAWERTDWYSCRWLCEDYHKCLKTGCRIEARRLGDCAGLFRLLGIVAPIAGRLLQLREIARLAPDRLANDVLPAELVAVVAALTELPPTTLTVGIFWREVAKLGGYLGRRRDGPPGWQSLWDGWLYVQTLLEGVHLAARLPPGTCA
jgi:hypothetical protein